jgi:hypothetical protein
MVGTHKQSSPGLARPELVRGAVQMLSDIASDAQTLSPVRSAGASPAPDLHRARRSALGKPVDAKGRVPASAAARGGAGAAQGDERQQYQCYTGSPSSYLPRARGAAFQRSLRLTVQPFELSEPKVLRGVTTPNKSRECFCYGGPPKHMFRYCPRAHGSWRRNCMRN